MLMTEIRKQSLGVLEVNDAAVMSLAESAQAVLGYSVLAKLKAKQRANAVEDAVLTPLQAALKKLEIDVLDERDVKLYQKERLIEETVIRVKKWMQDAGQLDEPSGFSGPDWHREKIAEYQQPIPEFVLAKALQIKQEFPECAIWVESLRDHPDPFLVVEIPNPRYEWMPGDESYHVEVWAEPKFEGRLAASGDLDSDMEIPF